MSDLISRQAAIDAVIKRDANCGIDSAEVLKLLPSAETDSNPCSSCQEFVCDGCAYAEKRDAQFSILTYLTDRPCAVCKCHTDDGCSKWECVFEGRTDD